MIVEIHAGKQSLRLNSPVIGAAGVFGFAGELGKTIDLTLLGAIVTNPVTLKPRRPANGMRIVPLDSGVLVHTGLPNPGIVKVHRTYASKWRQSKTPIIVHIIGRTPDEIRECAAFLDQQEYIAAIELGLNDQTNHRDARLMVGAAREKTQLPLLVKLPLYHALLVAEAAAEAGANALVVAATPRGVARDPISGALVGGRVYGPWMKSLALRACGQVAAMVSVPIIGCGGIHNADDARDYLEAGAIAVQVDSVAWVRPDMVATIARNLTGSEATRAIGALSDEWYQGIGDSATGRAQILPSPPPILPPGGLPEG